MKITAEVPVANAEGKVLALELDTTSNEVAVTAPTMWRTPRVTLADLQRAVDELHLPARLDSRRPPTARVDDPPPPGFEGEQRL